MAKDDSQERDNLRSLLPYLGGAALLGMYRPANPKIMQKQLERWQKKGYDAKLETYDPMKGWFDKFVQSSLGDLDADLIYENTTDLLLENEYKSRNPKVGIESKLDQAVLKRDFDKFVTELDSSDLGMNYISNGRSKILLSDEIVDTPIGDRVFAHELAHAYMGHQDKTINAHLPNSLKEAQAEAVAYGVLKKSGILSNKRFGSDLEMNSLSFVESYKQPDFRGESLDFNAYKKSNEFISKIVDEILPGSTESQRLVLGDRKVSKPVSDLPKKFTANPLGFTRVPALTSILGTGVGATAGNVLFRNLAKSFGLNEEQQQTAGNIGSVVGGFTGGTLGYGRNSDLRPPTLQEFAKAIATRNSDAGAVYLFGGSRTAAKMPGEVEKTLDSLLKGDRTPFLVLGDASGTDKIALDYAKKNKIPYQVMPADWSQGTMGGTKRDYEAVMAAKQISDTGYFGDKGDIKAHYFSVDKSMGTQHMANAALAYDIPTKMTHVESNLDRIVSVQEDLAPDVRSKVEKLLAQGIEPRESLVYASDKPIKKGERISAIATSDRPLEYKVSEPVDAVYQKGTADYDAALRAHAEGYRLPDEAIANLRRYAPVPRFMPAEEHARLQLFRGLRGTGLDLTQMARLSVPGVIPNPKDDLTGFIRGIEARDRTAARALDFSQKTGRVGHYISADIANLGGLNSTLGETGANKVYKRITDIYAEELNRAGALSGNKDFSLSNFRQGGDEFSSIVYGLEPGQIDEAVTRAQSRISDFVRSEGLSEIEHPKYKGDVTRRGTGITTAYAPLDPSRPVEETFSIVDKQLEANKKALRQSLDRRVVERSSGDLPYNLQTGDILDADKFAVHLEALPAHEQTSLLDRLAIATNQEANSWKQGLPKEQIDSIQRSIRLERQQEVKPDWSKLAMDEAPLQPGVLSGARQNAWKSAKLRGEKPPDLAYHLAGDLGVSFRDAVKEQFGSARDAMGNTFKLPKKETGYIMPTEFEGRVAEVARTAGVSEQKARAAVAQGRDIVTSEAIASAPMPESYKQAKQTIASMQSKYSGGTVGTPDAMLPPRTSRDRLAQTLKSNASHINQLGGDIGLEALQGADYAAKSLRRGENVETAIARAVTASATSIGASKLVAASLAKAPLPGIVKVGAQFVGAALAAYGADELISKAIGFDPERAAQYQSREMRALGETEDDRNKYSFQYVYNRATEGNQIADTVRPATDIAGSIIDSFNPVHIAKNLGESLANYTNRDSIERASYAQQRGDSLDAGRKIKPVAGEDNFKRSRILALQNLANELGVDVPRTGDRLDIKTHEALQAKGYTQAQISAYLQGKTKSLGAPGNAGRFKQALESGYRRSQGKPVTSSDLSAALSAERKAQGLKSGQKLSGAQVQGVFSGLAGGFR